jgi:hypothetical protein
VYVGTENPVCCLECEDLVAVAMEVTVLWDMALFSLVGRYKYFGGTCIISLQGRRLNCLGEQDY